MQILCRITNISSTILPGYFLPPFEFILTCVSCFKLTLLTDLNDFRRLVMDFCFASMLDFCQGKLTEPCNLELKDMMWQTASELRFLHDNNIIHGNLVLDKIFLWRQRPASKILIKIVGYSPKHANKVFI